MAKSPVFSAEFKDEVFYLWARRCKRNSRKTYRQLKERGVYTRVPSAKTIARWAEDDDWSVKAKYIDNEFKGIIDELDKSVLEFIGQDAIEAVFLDWLMRTKIVKAFRRRGRRALEPKSVNEAIALYKFATARADTLLERAEMGREQAQQPVPEQQRVLDVVRRQSIPEGMEQSRQLYRSLLSSGVGGSPGQADVIEAELVRPIEVSVKARRRAVHKRRRRI